MKFYILNELSQISGLKNQWNSLAMDRPFLSWEWNHSWYQSYCETKRPYVVVEKSAGQEPTWIAPLYSQLSTLGTNKLCSSGDGNVCTDRIQIVTLPSNESYSIAKFVRWLNSSNRESFNFDFVDLDGLSYVSPDTQAMIDQLTGVGFCPEVQQLESCWVVELENQWEQMDATFSKKHRRKTKKATSNLKDCVVSDSQSCSFHSLWSSFVNLHQKRRESLGESGCFADSRFCDFLQNAAYGLIQRGLAEILVIEYQRTPMAATLLFNDQTTTFMYQTGFDPQFAKLEPGYMLVVAAMNKAIRDGHQRFDFMRGDEQYKSRWNARPEPMIRLHFRLNDKLRVRLYDQMQLSKRVVKSTLGKLKLPILSS